MEKIIQNYKKSTETIIKNAYRWGERDCFNSIVEHGRQSPWILKRIDADDQITFPDPDEDILFMNTNDEKLENNKINEVLLYFKDVYFPRNEIDNTSTNYNVINLKSKYLLMKILGLSKDYGISNTSLENNKFDRLALTLKVSSISLSDKTHEIVAHEKVTFKDILSSETQVENTEAATKTCERILRAGSKIALDENHYDKMQDVEDVIGLTLMNFDHTKVYKDLLYTDFKFFKEEIGRLHAWIVLQTRHPLLLSLCSRLIIFKETFGTFPHFDNDTNLFYEKNNINIENIEKNESVIASFKNCNHDQKVQSARGFICMIFKRDNPTNNFTPFEIDNYNHFDMTTEFAETNECSFEQISLDNYFPEVLVK